jgi:hypothetical protein
MFFPRRTITLRRIPYIISLGIQLFKFTCSKKMSTLWNMDSISWLPDKCLWGNRIINQKKGRRNKQRMRWIKGRNVKSEKSQRYEKRNTCLKNGAVNFGSKDNADRRGSTEFSSFILLSPDGTVCYTSRSSGPHQNNRTEHKKTENSDKTQRTFDDHRRKDTSEQVLSGSCNRMLLHPFFVPCYVRSHFSLTTLHSPELSSYYTDITNVTTTSDCHLVSSSKHNLEKRITSNLRRREVIRVVFVSKDGITFIFKVISYYVTLKKGIRSSETSGTTRSMTRRHVLEDVHPGFHTYTAWFNVWGWGGEILKLGCRRNCTDQCVRSSLKLDSSYPNITRSSYTKTSKFFSLKFISVTKNAKLDGRNESLLSCGIYFYYTWRTANK